MQRDSATLLDILRAARLKVEFRGDLDEATFRTDYKAQAAVLNEFVILGEAVKRLSPAFRAIYPIGAVAGHCTHERQSDPPLRGS